MYRPIRSDSLCDAVALPRPPCCFYSTAELKNRPRLLHLAGQHVLVLSYCHMQETVSKLKYFYWLFLSDSCFYEFPRCLSWMKKKDFFVLEQRSNPSYYLPWDDQQQTRKK